MNYYRVKHPLQPDMFVWYIEAMYDMTDHPLPAKGFQIHFAKVRAPMVREEAEELADKCGGYLEPCKDI